MRLIRRKGLAGTRADGMAAPREALSTAPHESATVLDAFADSLATPIAGATIASTATEPRYLSDEDLWQAFRSGEDAAFSMLYARYGDRLYAYLKFLLAHAPRHLDDVFQETWITVFKERGAFHANTTNAFSGWLFRVAHNLAISQVRRDQKTIPIDDLDFDSELIEGFVVEAAQETYGTPNPDEVMHQVSLAVEELPLLLREVFVLSEFDHLTLEQIGEMLGISRTNAKVRLFRARREIRERLANVLDL
ncbi:MAG: sigma-70 family RNA polymerase sigma factor [Bacteroidota bacterium]|nr:sigma-70 family RNA polymerase sigma factor [Bacteroidota bacterium]MDP4234353.1 sigma-70 family RNA polymerase sigma factor [Bacteroidota bacterium]MDP4243287.1 sigma-70 family RNA polymerase sigma factor [Bacteroidota bacterium]MDP4287971.1 sigma-70 family RNA polymerase sigma factor [Bacteroidota bacterium]